VLELHRLADATGTSVGAVELWLDGRPVSDLSATSLDVGSAPVGAIQIGETQTNQTYDVAFDDVAFATSRLGVAADTTAPSVPTGLTGAATAPFSAQLSWSAATDDVGVAGYDISRDGAVIASLGAVTTFTDDTTLAGSDHIYLVRSRDASGNVSGWSDPLTVTQPAAATPLFTDGFESGDLSGWTTTSGLAVESADARSGRYAAEGVANGSPAYAKRTLPGTYTDAYARVAFEIKSQGSQLTLLRMRDTPGGVGGYVYLSSTGKLAFRSDALTAGTVSGVGVGPGWHVVELHLVVAGASSRTQVWLDGTAVGALSFPAIDLGSSPIGVLQIGDTAGVTADAIFDDAAFSTSRIGLGGDTTAPTAPSNVTATAVDGFTVAVAWTASTDNVGVSGYDVLRNGTRVASLPGDATSYTDTAALASTTYTYSVDARDAAGNVSDPGSAGVFTPAAAAPVFADGFESGNLSAWTSSGGLTVGTGDVHAGTYAAEGNTTAGNTYAKKTLPGTYTDAYARVAFEVKSQTSQINLLRLKVSSNGASIGYLYLNGAGRLGLHIDAVPAIDTLSTLVPSPGWHSLELHLSISTGTTDVWLDGVEVSALATNVNLGAAPVTALQIGDVTAGRTYDVLFDDAAFSTSRIGVDNSAVAPAV
jgi:chitodextrinase